MNILVVHNTYKVAGGEDTAVQNEIQLLRDGGIRVVEYIRSNEETEGNLFHKLQVPFRAIYNPKTKREIRSIIKREHIDLVHVHNTLLVVSPSVYFAAKKEGVPVVQTLHNFRMICPNALLLRDGRVCEDCLEKGLLQGVKHSCYRSSKLQSLMSAAILWVNRRNGIYNKLHYICLTEFNKKKLLSQNGKNGLQIDEDKVFVRPNFVTNVSDDGEQDNLLTEETAFEEPYFLYVGRLSVEKGFQVLLKGWKTYVEQGGTGKLVICGDGPMKDLLDQALKNENSRIVYLGKVEHKKALTLMSDAKALLLPSICYEGLPMTLCEAFAMSCPVIGCDMGNVGGLITKGYNGETFEAGNPDCLAEVFAKYMESVDRVQLGKNAFTTYQENYTQEAALQSILKIYEKVLGGRR